MTPGTNTQQALRLAAKLPQPKEPTDADAPRVIFPSPLQLNRDQEQALLQHAKNRLDKLALDSGRPVFDAPNYEPTWTTNNIGQALKSFMGQQYFNHLMFQGRVEWRAQDPDTIYADSNLHLPLSRRIITQQIARAIAYITGTEPWWTAYDVGNDDVQFARNLERWLRHELHTEMDLTAEVNSIIQLVWLQGQQVVKIAHHKDVDYFETLEEVVIGPGGQPVIALDGDYIFRHDTFVPAAPPAPPPTPAGPPALMPPGGDQAAEQPPEQAPPGEAEAVPPLAPQGPLVLKRDMQTPMPTPGANGQLVFKWVKIERKLTKFAGPKPTPIFYLDFLAPLDADNLEDADCCIHLLERTVIQLAHQYLQTDFPAMTAERQKDAIANLVQRLLPVSQQNVIANDGANAARTEHGELPGKLGADQDEPTTRLAEVWLRYDVNGDGIQENIMLLMDRQGQIPIYYDYVANLTTDAQRPFRCPTINKIAGRWYGQSQMTIFGNLQEAADLFLNRWSYSQSAAGRVDFWNPELTVEGKENPNLTLNGGRTYTKANPATTKEEILESVSLIDVKAQDLQRILEFIMQMAMNMSGVTNVNDGAALGLDTAKLATGVRNLERSGTELFGKYLADITPGLKEIVVALMETCLAHIDGPRVFHFFEGDVGRLGTITPEEVRNVNLDIRIELTRYRGEQEEAQNSQATAIFREFYALPYALQVRGLTLYRQRMKALQIREADVIISPLDPATYQPALPAPGQAAPAPAAQKPPPPVL